MNLAQDMEYIMNIEYKIPKVITRFHRYRT